MNPLVLGLVAATLTSSALLAGPLNASDAPDINPGRVTSQGQGPSPAATGQGQWPVLPASVERSFEGPEQYGAGHRGVDLAAWPGQVVRSALPGTVQFVGRVAGRPIVVVSHEGELRTTYLPVDPRVQVREVVDAGDRIGVLGTDLHCATVPCLHWGARMGDAYIDPLTLLSRQVVLLPTEFP